MLCSNMPWCSEKNSTKFNPWEFHPQGRFHGNHLKIRIPRFYHILAITWPILVVESWSWSWFQIHKLIEQIIYNMQISSFSYSWINKYLWLLCTKLWIKVHSPKKRSETYNATLSVSYCAAISPCTQKRILPKSTHSNITHKAVSMATPRN